MSKHQTLTIDYYNDFECIGNKCEDHCCKDWSITVDKATYNKYKKLPNSEFKKRLNENINRNRKSNTDSSYAKINLIDKKCPLLSEEGLCDVYKNLGPENMCYTCRTYPRIYNSVDGTIEKSLTFSCIEVARKALLREEPIEFNLEIENLDEFKIVNNIDPSKGMNINNKYFNELRIFSISLIQNRRFSIEERMAILGLFYNKINSNLNNKSIVLDSIKEYSYAIENGYYDNIFEKLNTIENIDATLEFLTNIYNIIISKGISNKRYIDNFKNIVEALQLGSDNPELIKENYLSAIKESYNPYMKKYDYIYENYLVNYMFKTLFPSGKLSLLDTYINLVVHFAILKMNIIGITHYYKENIDTNKIVNMIQSFAVITEHDKFLVDKLHDYLKENNLNTLAHMIILIGK